MRTISAAIEEWAIDGTFTISRGAKTKAEVITCLVEAETPDGRVVTGRGECVPYGRYGETSESVMNQITNLAKDLPDQFSRAVLQKVMDPGAARNALDCALWDMEAKGRKSSVANQLAPNAPKALPTAYTLSLDTPENMQGAARKHSKRGLLKIKVDGDNAEACILSVRKGAPQSRLIVDANEAWDDNNVEDRLAMCAAAGVTLVEQPLPVGEDDYLSRFTHAVPICADESAHSSVDLEGLCGKYDYINIKLDKTGGLTEALIMRDKAREMGFGIMVGCMVATSLSMAPAVLLAQDSDLVDLDGPLLLAKDRKPGLRYENQLVYPPEAELWG